MVKSTEKTVSTTLQEENEGTENREREAASVRTSFYGGPLADCLLLLAKHHGLTATRDSILAGLPLERGVLTPSGFSRAASRASFSSRIVRRSLGALNDLLFPAILLLRDGGACLISSVDIPGGKATLVFPELDTSPVEVPLEDLRERYTGHVIYCRPTFRFDERTRGSGSKKKKNWFWSVIAENRPLYRDLILATFMINIFALAMPLFVMNVYNRVVPNRAIETLWVLAGAVLMVIFADFILRMMRGYFVDLAAVRTNVKLSSSILEKVLGLRMEEKPPSTGSFASSLQSFESVRNFISSAAATAYVDLPFALIFVLVIGLISWQLVIPILIGGSLMILYALSIQGKMRDLAQTTYEASALRNATLVENLVALETVKAMGAEGRAQARWEKVVLYLEKTGAKLRLLSSSVMNGAMWCQFSVSVAVMITGVYLILDGSLSMGGLIAAYILSSRAMAPISRTAGLLTQYHQSARALESLDGIMKKEVERPEGVHYDRRHHFKGAIEFRDVSFAYPQQETNALKDVSLKVKPGEKVAILGKVGTGKSTLSRLILDLYRASDGKVLLDGIDVRQLDPSELRRNVGYVPQDVTLFYGSLRENIAMGAPMAGERNILAAAAMGGLKTFIDQHPRGLDLQVGERGEMLSSGQRQGVAIARALIKDPPILLMDEPTASMDQTTEGIVKKHLSRYAGEKTLIMVTHRTALLDLVNRIVVMDGGTIVLDGPRDEVLNALKQGKVKGAG